MFLEVGQGQWMPYPQDPPHCNICQRTISDDLLVHSRILHRLTPLLHVRYPPVIQLWCFRDHIWCIESRIGCLIRGFIPHLPKEPAFWIWGVSRDIQRPFLRSQTRNDVQTGLVHGTLRFLGVLERYSDLIAKIGPLIFLKIGYGLVKVVFEEV
jgi:hypothetical protein